MVNMRALSQLRSKQLVWFREAVEVLDGRPDAIAQAGLSEEKLKVLQGALAHPAEGSEKLIDAVYADETLLLELERAVQFPLPPPFYFR